MIESGTQELRNGRRDLVSSGSTVHEFLSFKFTNAARFAVNITCKELSRFLRERAVRSGALPRSVTAEQHLEANEWWLSWPAPQNLIQML